jgi:mannosyl-oligosaccharide alpha-1,2-mannosidase
MFKAIRRYTRTEHGFSTIRDVTSSAPLPKDVMESYWTAETLKYFYLLFSEPDVVSLDHYVL